MKKKRKVCVVINNRANYARIKSVLNLIKKSSKLTLQIICGSSSLLDKYGSLDKVIEKDKFNINRKIHFLLEGDSPNIMAKSTGLAINELSNIFDQIKPNIVLVVADRFETIAAAIAASYMNIPVAHTQGGEITGSIDELVRHATTKFSHIHFPATYKSKLNLIQMGEDPKKIFHVGCPSIDIINKRKLDIDEKFIKKYSNYGVGINSIDFKKKYIVVMQHPVTTEYNNSSFQIKQTVKAVMNLKNIQIIWLWPNIDAGTNTISKILRIFKEEKKPNNIRWQKNYTPEDYLKLIYNSKCIVGNSSSAIREGSFLGIPAVNIGNRQMNREQGKNLINVSYDSKKILIAIKKQINHGRYKSDKRFGNGKSAQKIIKVLNTINLNIDKSFRKIL